MWVGENINQTTQYLKSFLALGVELPGKPHVAGPTGAGEFVQESSQHGAGHQLLKSHTDLLMFYSVFITCLMHQYAGDITQINIVFILHCDHITIDLWLRFFIYLTDCFIKELGLLSFYSLFYLNENYRYYTTFFYVSKQGDISDFQLCVVWTVVTVFLDFFLTIVTFPLLTRLVTSWNMLSRLAPFTSTSPRFRITATVCRICSLT